MYTEVYYFNSTAQYYRKIVLHVNLIVETLEYFNYHYFQKLNLRVKLFCGNIVLYY
jgi:hypothetical protein